ncbi:cystathionine gamma-synthase family protein [Alginatibacterium sediminis]|uniref:Cystathionine gamma-synthase family protein n=1 Tax=Alginatibacterium sediminis TaxID=2164068 RepID=A0A420E9Y1_9ALTE|nr:cystathionine gamma-synthase family protein [Alginatibacterium sediminis]RKF17484.1 cystathionine gamma-synthase family protein [Alginatibacterium sediminis]
MSQEGITTRLVHADRRTNLEYGAIHAPVHNSVPYGYDNCQDLVDVFQGKQAGQAYARQSTPTTDLLAKKITELESGHNSLVFGSGMAAVTALFIALLKSGDHIVASRYLFGNTSSVFATLSGFGVDVSLIDACDINEVESALQPNTKMVFVETIANPATQIVDLEGIGEICAQRKLMYIVDNTLTTGYLYQAKNHGASLVVNSLSKYFGGHGNALGGSVTDTGLYDWSEYPNIYEGYRSGDPRNWGLTQVKKKALRDYGGSLSSTQAHLLSAGSDTLALRMDRQCGNAMALALFLDSHPKVAKVYYPGLSSHPHHLRAKSWFKDFGALVSFDLVDGKDGIAFLDACNIVINATHLGDNRTLALPVAPTIYFEMGLEARRKSGISEGMLRCSIGIEDSADLIADFEQALDLI